MRRRWRGILALAITVLAIVMAPTASAEPEDRQPGKLAASRDFPTTGHTVSGGFYQYWEQFGGLAVFGYPLTDELQENGRNVQYFERARFEYHPDATVDRFGVLLGRLGALVAVTSGLREQPSFHPTAAAERSDCIYFPETSHNLCGGFRAYWEQFGGITTYGFPIGEEAIDPVTGQIMQYFERQRFEWQPGAWPERFDVLLGRLGAEYLEQSLKPADASLPAAGVCQEPSGDLVTITVHADVPAPRCVQAFPSQQLYVSNDTDAIVHVSLAAYVVTLAAGEAYLFDRDLGDFLAPGVHHVTIVPFYHAELWLVDDASGST